MVSVEADGDYKIVNGTTAEVLQQLKSDEVTRNNILGFVRDSESEVTVMYHESG